jgi:EAL domain-containing protein (putative c-di-GMP-specific phosphodiesterase class I)
VALVRYLQATRAHPLLFNNLSNQGMLDAAIEDLVRAAQRNNLIFELSESVNEYGQRERIAEKVNALIDQGVPVAIDDFGAGRDSLERLYELGPTTAVKIDRVFLQTCARRSDAASTLQHLIHQWRGAGVMSIAEGVESDALYEFARLVGFDMVQGWHVDSLVHRTRRLGLAAVFPPPYFPASLRANARSSASMPTAPVSTSPLKKTIAGVRSIPSFSASARFLSSAAPLHVDAATVPPLAAAVHASA